jgi:hypothetical protein
MQAASRAAVSVPVLPRDWKAQRPAARAELERQPIEEDDTYTILRVNLGIFSSPMEKAPRKARTMLLLGRKSSSEGGGQPELPRRHARIIQRLKIYFVVGHRLARPTKRAPSHHASSTHGSEHEKLRVARVNLRAETAAQLNASRKILALQHIAHTEASHRAFR